MSAEQSQDRTPSRHLLGRRGFTTGLILTLAGAGQVDVPTVLAQCVGPDVPCPAPDGIARRARVEVYRMVRNGGHDYAISDAGVRLSILAPVGTSDHPELDRQNPMLGPDGLPQVFVNLKTGELRRVERNIILRAADPSDPRFESGRLIDDATGLDYVDIPRAADAIKDRAVGKLRGAHDCEGGNCQLNCAETVVWQRQRSGHDLRPFVNSRGQTETFQAVAWSFSADQQLDSRYLVSYTDVSDDQLRMLISTGQAKLIKGPSPLEVSLRHQLEVAR
jgi:hypothetical protein